MSGLLCPHGYAPAHICPTCRAQAASARAIMYSNTTPLNTTSATFPSITAMVAASNNARFSPAPLAREPVAEPLVGYRVFDIGRVKSGCVLCALTVGSVWGPGVNRASCRRMDGMSVGPTHPDVAAPFEHCACGFWAYKTPELLAGHASNAFVDAPVRGEVELWGKVVECAYGYRAEYARVRSLQVVGETCVERGGRTFASAQVMGQLAARYGVPVELVEPVEPYGAVARQQYQQVFPFATASNALVNALVAPSARPPFWTPTRLTVTGAALIALSLVLTTLTAFGIKP